LFLPALACLGELARRDRQGEIRRDRQASISAGAAALATDACFVGRSCLAVSVER
jgi:hypothetical protein